VSAVGAAPFLVAVQFLLLSVPQAHHGRIRAISRTSCVSGGDLGVDASPPNEGERGGATTARNPRGSGADTFPLAGLVDPGISDHAALAGAVRPLHAASGYDAIAAQLAGALCRVSNRFDILIHKERRVYYPPYHSKYNAIERYRAGLEKSWNGYLLSTVDAVLNRAGNFFWKGMRSVARRLDGVYEKGVSVCSDEKPELESRLKRSTTLYWWDITIQSKAVY